MFLLVRTSAGLIGLNQASDQLHSELARENAKQRRATFVYSVPVLHPRPVLRYELRRDRKLCLQPNVTGIVLPLAVSTFKLATPALWLMAAIFLGQLYGVPLTVTQLFVVALTAILTSFSIPGVPHGWLLVISPLVATMGIPVHGVGLLIAVDAIPDIFATTLNVTADMLVAAIVSRNHAVADSVERVLAPSQDMSATS